MGNRKVVWEGASAMGLPIPMGTEVDMSDETKWATPTEPKWAQECRRCEHLRIMRNGRWWQCRRREKPRLYCAESRLTGLCKFKLHIPNAHAEGFGNPCAGWQLSTTLFGSLPVQFVSHIEPKYNQSDYAACSNGGD